MQPLKVVMDPRSSATPAELAEQQRVGLEIFGAVRSARSALAEIASAKKKLAEVKQKAASKDEMLEQIKSLESAINDIEKGSKQASGEMGLETASSGLSSALRVVESSDRPIPSQALELYKDASKAAGHRIAQWTQLKASELVKLNNALQHSGLSTVRTWQNNHPSSLQTTE